MCQLRPHAVPVIEGGHCKNRRLSSSVSILFSYALPAASYANLWISSSLLDTDSAKAFTSMGQWRGSWIQDLSRSRKSSAMDTATFHVMAGSRNTCIDMNICVKVLENLASVSAAHELSHKTEQTRPLFHHGNLIATSILRDRLARLCQDKPRKCQKPTSWCL